MKHPHKTWTHPCVPLLCKQLACIEVLACMRFLLSFSQRSNRQSEAKQLQSYKAFVQFCHRSAVLKYNVTRNWPKVSPFSKNQKKTRNHKTQNQNELVILLCPQWTTIMIVVQRRLLHHHLQSQLSPWRAKGEGNTDSSLFSRFDVYVTEIAAPVHQIQRGS